MFTNEDREPPEIDGARNRQGMDRISVVEENIVRLFKGLDRSKSPGPDIIY